MSEELKMVNGIDFDVFSPKLEKHDRKPEIDLLLNGDAEARLQGGEHKGLVAGVDPNDLAQAGWGIIVHENEHPQILEALEPLINHRREQAGALFKLLHYKEGDGLDDFRERYGIHRGDADPERLPYYLLLVGGPHHIPFAFQTELDVSYAVGRLYFDSPHEYAVYSENLLADESDSSSDSPGSLLFFSPDNGDRPTSLSNEALVSPLVEHFRSSEEKWEMEILAGKDATRSALRGKLHSKDRRGLLFTAAHGVTFSDNFAMREAYQGGILCSDFQMGDIPNMDHAFFGRDVDEGINLSGVIAFLFGCYSAGTPQIDTSRSPDQVGTRQHPYSFISNLPKAMLAHEKGALAVIGHVDACFQYSFLWKKEISELGHFQSTLKRLMKGDRVGHAMEHFARRLSDIVLTQTARAYDPDPPSPEDMKVFWLMYQDARNYIILGDPAARLVRGETWEKRS